MKNPFIDNENVEMLPKIPIKRYNEYSCENILLEVFGHQSFRNVQEEIITHITNKNDCFVVLPTGGGKSLCYQIPMLKSDGMGIVISPLLSLIKDQVDNLQKHNVSAYSLNSTVSPQTRRQIEYKVKNKEVKILYLSPEKFISNSLQRILKNVDISYIAFDEAHCLSQWGNDFRPTYVEASKLATRSSTNIIALTASADPETRSEILEKLNINNKNLFIQSFDRPNLKISMINRADNYLQLIANKIKNADGSSIIFCDSRKKVEQVSKKLKELNVDNLIYHAGIDTKRRDDIQHEFMNTEKSVVVATIAFGMGVDKSNIRLVIHTNASSNIEAYYQEIGRAGRDNLPAEVILFYSHTDFSRKQKIIMDSDGISNNLKQHQITKLNELHNIIISENCRRRLLLNHFGEESIQKCDNCDRCLSPLSATTESQSIIDIIIKTIKYTGEEFGIGHICDILIGNNSKNIAKNRHNKLDTYSALSYLTKDNVRNILYQLIQKKYLTVDYTNFSLITVPNTIRTKEIKLYGDFLRIKPKILDIQEHINKTSQVDLLLKSIQKICIDPSISKSIIEQRLKTVNEISSKFPSLSTNQCEKIHILITSNSEEYNKDKVIQIEI